MPSVFNLPVGRDMFWSTFLRALETDPIEAKPFVGASGLSHPVVATGVDVPRRRLVLISADPDARSAALAQSDIQAANMDLRVIMARPIAIDLSQIATAISKLLRRMEIRASDLKRLSVTGQLTQETVERRYGKRMAQFVRDGLQPALQALTYASLNTPATWQDVLGQLAHLEVVFAKDQPANSLVTPVTTVRMGSLIALDPAESDRQMGICSIPLYSLQPDQAELFRCGSDIEQARAILREANIFQYFFPAPDQLALGIIERGQATATDVVARLKTAPDLGHPLSGAEFLSPDVSLSEMTEMLKQQGYAVEGELGMELTSEGLTRRASVRFTPREGFLQKLSRVVKIDISFGDIKDLLK